MHPIYFVEDICTDFAGFNNLANIYSAAQSSGDSEIVFDLSYVRRFDANMVSPLAVIKLRLNLSGKKVSFRGLRGGVERGLRSTGFFGDVPPSPLQSTIPFSQFGLEEAKKFASYTDIYLRGKGIPKMSIELRKKFLEGLDEIFNNAAIHSSSPGGVFCSGQAIKEGARLEFVIADAGVGMKNNIKNSLGLELSAPDAINWSMSGSNTTRLGDMPGGLGLKILREFIQLNKGEIIVVSDAGYWSFREDRVLSLPLATAFPGTAVNVEIKTNDTSRYYLASEGDAGFFF